jgi:hypothetical protein
MSKPDFNSHPISMVPGWLAELGDDWAASFSRYMYSPQTIADDRERFTIPLKEVTPAWLERQLADLPAGVELAMDSTLLCGRRVRHIPMVDFSAGSEQLPDVISWTAKHLGLTLRLFESGRSYHAYGSKPISEKRWVQLMGLLLLANFPDRAPLVDARWIGHRLLAGYASLRWSKNSDQYLATPTLVASTLPP